VSACVRRITPKFVAKIGEKILREEKRITFYSVFVRNWLIEFESDP